MLHISGIIISIVYSTFQWIKKKTKLRYEKGVVFVMILLTGNCLGFWFILGLGLPLG